MKNLKLLILLVAITITSVSLAKSILIDKIYLKNLEPHKDSSTELKIPTGTTSVTVEPSDNKLLISCQFVNSSGFVGLQQNDVPKCLGNVHLLSSDDILIVKVINNNDSLIEYRIHQITTSK